MAWTSLLLCQVECEVCSGAFSIAPTHVDCSAFGQAVAGCLEMVGGPNRLQVPFWG